MNLRPLLALSLLLPVFPGCLAPADTTEAASPGEHVAEDREAALLDPAGLTYDPRSAIVGQSGMCLEYAPDSLTNLGNPRAVMRSCTGALRQQWWVNGSYIRSKADTNLCLNIEGGVAGTSVVLYRGCAGYANEMWSLEDLGDGGRVRIRNPASGKCLSVYGALRSPGTGTVVDTCTDAPNSAWFAPRGMVHKVKLRPILFTNDDGVSGTTWIDANGAVTASAKKTFSDAVAQVNRIYERAGITLTVADTDWTTVASTSINTTVAGNAGPMLQDPRDLFLRTLASPVFVSGFVPVMLTNTGGGFAGAKRTDDYLKMPSNLDKTEGQTGLNGYAGVFAHELGHYFGLVHTFNDSLYATTAQAKAQQFALSAGWTLGAFDADGLADTYPDPGPWVYEERASGSLGTLLGYQGCSGGEIYNLPGLQLLGGVFTYPSITLQPDRLNMMSYFRCDLPAIAGTPNPLRLTPQQAALMNATLRGPLRAGL